MTLLKSVLIVIMLSSPLVTSVPTFNHPKEHTHHKSLKVTGYPLPGSQSSVASQEPSHPEIPVISQESNISTNESPSSSQNDPVLSTQQKPATAQESTNLQHPEVSASGPTSSSPKGTDGSEGLKLQGQGSAPSSIRRYASLQESKDYSVEDNRENVLQRVKRQQRCPPKNRKRGGSLGTAIEKGTPKRFCNQFGCNDNNQSSNGNSQCPSGTRFDKNSNKCRQLSGG